MLERVVAYLRSRGVPFRLFSHPSPEPLPSVGHALPRGGVAVDGHVVLVGGRPAIACVPRGDLVNLERLSAELGISVVAGSPADLPAPYTGASAPIPPLGGELGTLVLVDESMNASSVIAFEAFAPTDCFELLYDDFARLERPRLASFADRGELPELGEDEGRKVA
jgi:hypothetical protein